MTPQNTQGRIRFDAVIDAFGGYLRVPFGPVTVNLATLILYQRLKHVGEQLERIAGNVYDVTRISFSKRTKRRDFRSGW
jgi:hypothetical protein